MKEVYATNNEVEIQMLVGLESPGDFGTGTCRWSRWIS